MNILTLDLYTQLLTEKESFYIYKHSATCGRSAMVKQGVDKRLGEHSDIALYMIVIQDDRELSTYVAEHTGIQHESPQMIVFKDGEVVSHEKRRAIDAEYLDGTLGL